MRIDLRSLRNGGQNEAYSSSKNVPENGTDPSEATEGHNKVNEQIYLFLPIIEVEPIHTLANIQRVRNFM